jgi:hypothetical protein
MGTDLPRNPGASMPARVFPVTKSCVTDICWTFSICRAPGRTPGGRIRERRVRCQARFRRPTGPPDTGPAPAGPRRAAPGSGAHAARVDRRVGAAGQSLAGQPGRTLSTASSTIAARVAVEPDPMWGRTMQFGSRSSRSSGGIGSTADTSSPTAKRRPSASASPSARWSTTGPRDVFTRIAVGRMRPSSRAPIRLHECQQLIRGRGPVALESHQLDRPGETVEAGARKRSTGDDDDRPP